MAVINVSELSFKYEQDGDSVLRDISFEVDYGEILGIIGANGSGKSTLCQIAAGLIPHYITGEMSGKVFLEAKSTLDMTMGELSQKVGLVFQNPFNQLTYTASTVRDELAFGLGNIGMEREKMQAEVERMAELMRLTEILDHDPLQLSGGQIQRVALGSCLIMKPDILILDECCSQLDPVGSEEIFKIIYQLKKAGITILVVDHDMERIASIADRILVLNEGNMIVCDETRKVFSNLSFRKYIEVPDYTKMSEVLQEKGRKVKSAAITEEEIVRQMKEVQNGN